MGISLPSSPVFSLKLPKVELNQPRFIYNFYVADESVNPDSGLPDYYKQFSSTGVKMNGTENAVFSRRVPRFVQISWTPSFPIEVQANLNNNSLPLEKVGDYPYIKENVKKIVTEDNFLDFKFVPYIFTGDEKIDLASQDIINSTKNGSLSQATYIDNFANSLLEKFSPSVELENNEALKSKIVDMVKSIEKFGDDSKGNLGLYYLNQQKEQEISVSGFEAIKSQSETISCQINSLVLSDIFASVQLPPETVNKFNNFQVSATQNGGFSPNNIVVDPVEVFEELEGINSNTIPEVGAKFIGYIVEKYEKLPNGSWRSHPPFVFEDPKNLSFSDISVKYGATYFYAVRTVARIVAPTVDNSSPVPKMQRISYYISSQPTFQKVDCVEMVPPPPPSDFEFLWNYSTKKLSICWNMPNNPQRDIKQIQVFRRKSIREPFELIAQKHFDFSSNKYLSGEVVDGNLTTLSSNYSNLLESNGNVILHHVDEDFKVDIETMSVSKYIYALGSVDAHGFVSNYSKQVEVSFDFFKNQLTTKMVSYSQAPRPYPNLYLELDLFKDTIKVSGVSSTNMKVYFMPEYFRISNNARKIQKMVSTNQDGGYYRMQFINTQNQKTEFLDIKIDDPNGLASG